MRKIGRNERTVRTNYNKAAKRMSGHFVLQSNVESVPMSIFRDSKLSVMGAVVLYLKEKGYRNIEIAEMFGKDSRNIWTFYDRGRKKIQKTT